MLMKIMSSAEEELIDEINVALDVEEGFDNLIDAAEALLDQFLESDEEEDEAPEYVEEGTMVVVEGAMDYESLSELDKELLIGEAEEDEEVSDESDQEAPAQSLTPLEIKLQIREKMLQL